MSEYAYIEQLRVCPLRPPGPLPKVSSRLVELVQDYGAFEPVVVREVSVGQYEILSNIETWMAAQQAQVDRVPVHVLDGISEREAAELVAASFGGFQADPIDEAEFFEAQLGSMEQGRSRYRAFTKLAYLTGHSRSYVSHSVRLLKLPVDIQALIRDGKLHVGHARALVSVKLRSAQLALAKQVVNERLSVRRTEDIARGLRDGMSLVPSKEEPSPTPTADPNTVRLQNQIGEQLGCQATIDTTTCRLTIAYHNLDILDGVLVKLGVSTG